MTPRNVVTSDHSLLAFCRCACPGVCVWGEGWRGGGGGGGCESVCVCVNVCESVHV